MLVMSQPSRISALLELVLFDKTVEDARNSADHSRCKDRSRKVCLWSSTSQLLLKIGFSRPFTPVSVTSMILLLRPLHEFQTGRLDW